MKTEDLPTDLTLFLREMGLIEDMALPNKTVSATLTYKVWLPTNKEEEIPF
jgi:hypothetical protein|tara:strand:+ start:83 stop:235 length:153 start_codon:yes stop_codon:yes gene_type:complete